MFVALVVVMATLVLLKHLMKEIRSLKIAKSILLKSNRLERVLFQVIYLVMSVKKIKKLLSIFKMM